MDGTRPLPPNEAPCRPRFGRNNYVAETAYICGNVTFGDDCSVWPGVVIRGDISPIRIGQRVNIQDGTIIHTVHTIPLDIEDEVSFGHRSVAHCRRIGQGTLVGIGAIVLDDCEIGERCLIAAGAVLTPGTIVPDGKLVVGTPAKIVRDLTQEELGYLNYVTCNYARLATAHLRNDYPRVHP